MKKSKRSWNVGADNPRCKLNDDQARALVRDHARGHGYRRLAEVYNISIYGAWYIVNRRNIPKGNDDE
jgi:hypothetical protein